MDDSTDYEVKESITEYTNGWFNAGYDRVEQPDGSEKQYYWADLDPAVTIVAIKEDGDLLLVEQYRPVIQKSCTEVPTGMVDPGESYEEAASRELEEETGYIPGETHLLETYNVANGILRHERGVVVATDLADGEQDLDDNEFLEVIECSPEEAIQIARDDPVIGATLDALFIAGLDGYIELP